MTPKIPNVLPSGYTQLVTFVMIASGVNSVQEIADAMLIEPEAVYVNIHRIMQKGLIKRKYPKRRRHKSIFCLTETGVEVKNFLSMHEE